MVIFKINYTLNILLYFSYLSAANTSMQHSKSLFLCFS